MIRALFRMLFRKPTGRSSFRDVRQQEPHFIQADSSIAELRRDLADFDDMIEAFIGPEFRERKRLKRLESAIDLAKQRVDLRQQIIDLSKDDPEFGIQLCFVIRKMGL